MMTERKCGSCSLCCKLLAVTELDKPLGKWCEHCKPGRGGCGIYDNRPESCREYECHWLRGDLSEHWEPLRCGMVTLASDGFLNIYVEGGTDRFRHTPWSDDIRRMAEAGFRHRAFYQCVTITIHSKSFLVIPNDPIELWGPLEPVPGQPDPHFVLMPGVRRRSGRWVTYGREEEAAA